MGHLIRSFQDVPIQGAIDRLKLAHSYITTKVAESARSSVNPNWGTTTKRSGVSLVGDDRPPDIDKDREGVSEILNMVATVERLIGTLQWLLSESGFERAVVARCHPTTSDAPSANDLVLEDPTGRTLARVEICDVVAARGDGNRKEASCLRKLGCTEEVPRDGVRRFIGTSPEFARHLTRRRRTTSHYRFQRHEANDPPATAVMELLRQEAPNP